MTRVVALGDSFTCGEGVGLRTPVDRTWSALLAAALPAEEYVCLARPGARAADVLAHQLPAALDVRPDLVTLLIGLNDVCRAGFDPGAVADAVRVTIESLRGADVGVLVMRLHDPTAALPMPSRLRQRVQERVAAVNAAVPDEVPVVDLARVPGLRRRNGWAVDRLHPSPAGHAAIARAAADLLRPGAAARVPVQLDRPPRRVDEAAWLVRHGVPYLATHARQVLAPALAACA